MTSYHFTRQWSRCVLGLVACLLAQRAPPSQGLNLRFSTGMPNVDNQYHIPVIRTTLTRNLSALADDIFDEIRAAFADVMPPKNGKLQWRT